MKPITIKDIIARVNRVATRSERSIRSDMDALGIACVGIRTRPQRYPANAADQIIQRLGLTPAAPGRALNPGTAWKQRRKSSIEIVTMPELRAEQQKARGK